MKRNDDRNGKIKRAAAMAAAVLMSVSAPAISYGAGPAVGPGGPGGPASGFVKVGDYTLSDEKSLDVNGTEVAGVQAKGISVSKYQNRASEEQGGIDWQRVKNSGISFAYIRMGYHNDLDPYYQQNMKEASEAGLNLGVFFYTQALDTETAMAEAEFVLSQMKDYPVSYPVAYDVESQHLLDSGLTKQQITDQINAFCGVIEAAGYRPIVYANNLWLTEHIDSAQIPYDIWYARYGSTHEYPGRTIWQCTEQGQVDGIAGNVTIEYDFVNYPAM